MDLKEVQEEVSKEQNKDIMGILDWLYLLLVCNIPVIGWLVVIFGSFGKHKTEDKKRFCRAYILFKLVMLLLSLIVLVILIKIGANFVEVILNTLDTN